MNCWILETLQVFCIVTNLKFFKWKTPTYQLLLTYLPNSVFWVSCYHVHARILCQISKKFKQWNYDNFKFSIKNKSSIWCIYNYVCYISEDTPERTELPTALVLKESQILHLTRVQTWCSEAHSRDQFLTPYILNHVSFPPPTAGADPLGYTHTGGGSLALHLPTIALITEEGFLISPCYSLELCIHMGISFLFFFAFHVSSFLSYL